MAITGLAAGKQYEFRVYAENIYGRSEPSEPTSLVQTKAIVKKEFKKKEYPGLWLYSTLLLSYVTFDKTLLTIWTNQMEVSRFIIFFNFT